jgi:hypothetical protein
MTRYLFGGVADYVISKGTDNVATLVPSTTVTCWNQPNGGTQYTDLTDTDGTTAVTTLTTDANGSVPEFYGPDGVTALYLDANGGSGPRRRTLATGVSEAVSTLQTGKMNNSVIAAEGELIVGGGSAVPTAVPSGSAGNALIFDSRVPGKVRWSPSWRRRNLPDAKVVSALSADAPTMSVAKQSTSTISGAQALIAPDTGPFLYLGAGDFTYGGTYPDTTTYQPKSLYSNTYDDGQTAWSVEFCTNAQSFEIMFKYFNSAARYRLWVDGKRVTDLPQVTGASTAGSRYVMKASFPTAVSVRRIRFDFYHVPFGGLFLPAGASAWKPAAGAGRIGVLGDSITGGSSQNEGASIGTWLYRTATMLGCDDYWNQSLGGTGYVADNGKSAFAGRVALDIAPYAFDRLIVWGGVNDLAVTSTAGIRAAADSLYPSLIEALPTGADLMVIGCYDGTGTPSVATQDCDNTLKDAASSAGLPFISPLTGSVYDSAGSLVSTQGQWITPQNVTSFVGADGVHPTDAGHEYLSHRILEALKALMPH